MSWKEHNVDFPFNFGMVNLGTIYLPGLLYTDHFLTLDESQRQHPPAALAEQRGRVAYIPSCPVSESEQALSVVDGHLRYISCRYPHYYVEKNEPFDDYIKTVMGKRSRKVRHTVRRWAKDNGGKHDLREYRTPEQARVFHAIAQDIGQRTYQQRWLKELLPSVEKACAAAERGQLIGHVLFAKDDKPVSFLWSRLMDDRSVIVQDYTGYDNDFAAQAPGQVLYYLVIEQLFADPSIRIIDLTEGEGLHKRRFANASQLCGDVYFLRLGLRNASIALTHYGFMTGYETAAAKLRDSPLRQRLRDLLRRQAAK